jgi:diguanylate cyclase (GGDEF)-like protein
MIIQLHYSKLFFAWNSISLGILITFIYLELQPGEKDFLTKLYNRQSYEKYVNQLIESKKTFQVALLDLNSFKQINDRLGHQIGDRVLVAFGKILRDELPDCYLASRMAGDEFMLVMNEETIVDHLVEKICNKLKNHSFSVMNSLSFAYGFCKYEEGMTIDELYAVVDKNMYENKYCVLNKKKLEMN